jgi:hypothetical protein
LLLASLVPFEDFSAFPVDDAYPDSVGGTFELGRRNDSHRSVRDFNDPRQTKGFAPGDSFGAGQAPARNGLGEKALRGRENNSAILHCAEQPARFFSIG